MDYDANFEISFDSKASSLRSSSAKTSSSNDGIDEDRLAERIIQKLGHVQRPPQPFRQHGFASQQSTSGPYACGICAGPHPTEKCASYMPGANQPSTKHWCLVCKWNTTHPTQDCMHIARWAKERDASRAQGNYHGNFQHGYVRQEMAKPVLGAQPPPPGTMPVRYVEANHQEPSMELVSTPPYYQESSFENYEPHEEFVEANKHPYYVTYPQETNSMMLVGPMQSRMPPYGQQPYPQRRAIQASPGVKCFKCQGDHLMRDCPELVPQQQKSPPIERHCVKCCSEHFPKDCPSKQEKLSIQIKGQKQA